MATYNKFNVFTKDLLEKKHAFGVDTFKAYLSNATPDAAADAIKGDLAEITPANGYSAGGPSLPALSVTAVSGSTYKVTAGTNNITITASGGSVGPFRYVVIYNDSQTSPADPLVCWYDYGSSITLNDGETFTIDFDDSNGLFQLG